MARKFRDAAAALDDLLDAAEREPGRTRNLVYPDYQAMTKDAERQAFHRVMADAEAAQAVEVRRRRDAGPENIRFIDMADMGRLAAFLRRDPAGDAAARAIAALRARVGPVSGWIDAIVDEIAVAWTLRKEPYPGLVPCDVVSAEKFLRILAAIDRGEHLRGWDMRTFSRHACGDSKAVEAATARLARVLRGQFNLPEVRPREVLAALGIEKFPWPVLIRGRLRLADGSEIAAYPYHGLPPEAVNGITILGHVPYVIVIENLASFNRYTREIRDGSVVVYSGGFPSRATLDAIRRLDVTLPRRVAIFHWGDADHHGQLILEHIRAAIGRDLLPHLMDKASVEEQEAINPEPPRAALLAQAGEAIGLVPVVGSR
jgi:Uncharacterized protein conserved in bacteria C-term(DUF2220)